MIFIKNKFIKLMTVITLTLAILLPTNMVANAAVSLTTASDNAYIWLKAQQDLTIGSAADGMVDSFDDWWDPANRKQLAYSYDQGIAAIAFMLKNDRARAEKVLTKMADYQDTDGSWINSYWWINGFGEEIRKHVGVVAWMAMAYMTYEKKYGDTRYQTNVKKALDWCISFQKANGGISGGKTQWDVPNTWTDEVWTSTEHNEDMYNLLKYYANIFTDRTTIYNNAAASVKSFLDNVVWDDTVKRWTGGFKNNTNLVDPSIPMDVNPWGVLALGLTGTRDYKQALAFVDNANGTGTVTNPKYVQTLDYDGLGNMMTAYDFDWQYDCAPALTQTGQPNGNRCADIWLEGSAFMSTAHYMNGNTVKADSILNEMIKKQGTSGSLLGGLPYSLKGSNNNYWKMNQENCVSSTGWLIIAIARYNPFTGNYLTGVTTDPTLNSLSPLSGPVGTTVTVSGTNFGATKGTSTLKFGTTIAVTTAWSDSSITATVPTGLANGSTPVIVTVGTKVSNTINFTIGTATTTPTPTSTPTATPTPTPTSTPVGDYTKGVTSLNSTQAKIWFTPTISSVFVDVHYIVNGGGQQNFRMTNTSGIWEQTLSGLSNGTVIEYWFTYEKSGPQYDTAHFTYMHGGTTATPTPVPTTTPTPVPTTTPTATPTPSTGNVLYINSGGVLSTTAGTTAAINTLTSAAGVNYDGTPTNSTSYLISGITRTYDSTKATAFNLFVDAGANAGDGVQVQVQYDFTGDGTWDRTETYNYFATNPAVDWESYLQSQGLKSSSGSFASLVNGKVQIKVWNAIGNTSTSLRTNASSANGQQSKVTIPFS